MKFINSHLFVNATCGVYAVHLLLQLFAASIITQPYHLVLLFFMSLPVN